MKANFVTSGFPDGFTVEFTSELKKYSSDPSGLIKPAAIAFVSSDFGAHEKTAHYLRVFSEMFESSGIGIKEAYIVDFSLTPEECADCIRKADIVWLAGGPTLTQIGHIKRYGLIEPLREREGVTIGMSAGSINMARRVVLARDPGDGIPELAIYDGIGLVDFNIEPHLNEASAAHIEDVKRASLHAPIYGLYDGAFIKDIGGRMEIFGKYRLFDGGR